MAEDGQLISCETVASWNEQLHTVKESKKLVVVNFTASWCAPSRSMIPILVELAKKLPDVIFFKVDVDDLKTATQDFDVEALPTFILLKQGNIVDKVVGARKDELQQKITLHGSNV
ncbi:thioredoxin H-type 5, THIOREDOXIN H-TYPE 5, LOCUS OF INSENSITIVITY TO VICTORIN 1 [Hibiscus trionum]|uniref:Thioredoxin n=1 Tax=Hibiscus trionum TaxID=183268 RepID=A0A9W7I6H5_HIBTR|nr:thioredoxin H-type 5, THIOREDOXIN H-TYPE 5, LOCUS OF INSENSITIVITY TO VICTORIN 1 [Hibiscus trionum]